MTGVPEDFSSQDFLAFSDFVRMLAGDSSKTTAVLFSMSV